MITLYHYIYINLKQICFIHDSFVDAYIFEFQTDETFPSFLLSYMQPPTVLFIRLFCSSCLLMFDFIPCLSSDIEKTNVTYRLAGSLQQVAYCCLMIDVLVMIDWLAKGVKTCLPLLCYAAGMLSCPTHWYMMSSL